MRKWAWSCVALLLLASAGVYLAADHAARHPDSFVGRCAISASRLTSRISPIVLVRATHVLPCRGVSECRPPVDETPSIAAPCSPNEPIVVDVEPIARDLYAPQTTENFSPAKVVPARMPYADEQPATETPTESTDELTEALRRGLSSFVSRSSTDEPILETSQAVVPPSNVDDLNELDGVHYPRFHVDYHHHYQCCPYTGRCPQPYQGHDPVLPRADEPDMNQTRPEPNGAAQSSNTPGSVND